MTEEWLWVPGYEGLYEVSTLGGVRSYWQVRGLSMPHPLKINTFDNYPSVQLHDGTKKARTFRVHRLVLETFVGLPEPDSGWRANDPLQERSRVHRGEYR